MTHRLNSFSTKTYKEYWIKILQNLVAKICVEDSKSRETLIRRIKIIKIPETNFWGISNFFSFLCFLRLLQDINFVRVICVYFKEDDFC